VINSEELNAGNAKSTVEMSLYEKSKMDAALHNAVDDRDGAAIPVKSSKAGKS